MVRSLVLALILVGCARVVVDPSIPEAPRAVPPQYRQPVYIPDSTINCAYQRIGRGFWVTCH
jgi:hypothetical protein